jgi:hypothetical protein
VEAAPGGLGFELLPTPEPDEVVAMVIEELKIRAIVKLF